MLGTYLLTSAAGRMLNSTAHCAGLIYTEFLIQLKYKASTTNGGGCAIFKNWTWKNLNYFSDWTGLVS